MYINQVQIVPKAARKEFFNVKLIIQFYIKLIY